MTSPLLDALRRAVAAAPHDVELRLHLAAQLIQVGLRPEAIGQLAAVLQLDPTHPDAQQLMAAALGAPTAPEPASTMAPPPSAIAPAGFERPLTAAVPDVPPGEASESAPDAAAAPRFDWRAAEAQLGDVAGPMFVQDEGAPDPTAAAYDVQRPGTRMADVGGMSEVKARLEAAFFAPLRNPQLRQLYGKSLRGGLLLYGPPGCGKTFLARAMAGELGAGFISLSLTDVLDPYLGNSERNLHEAFQLARREAPCVLFLDEVDSIGQRRSQMRNNAMRNTVNTLLTELDGVEAGNDGVFVLAATNQPWEVDPALRRPGRLDRTLLVLPPDAPARASIFRYHLQQRPVEAIDLNQLAAAADGLSGADIAYVCELAVESALLDSVRTGQPRLVQMADLQTALQSVRPSISGWLESARNVVLFGDDDGTYRELKDYLKKLKRL